ncbi:MAG: LodA/GoxA family CTQ-dependent oxidase [Acidimicrobiales bacterium]
MTPTYKIHPAIGVARVGNSPDEFYLAPESTGAAPIACDGSGDAVLGPDGREVSTTRFKDDEGRILRQAARFQVFVYDETSPEGRPLVQGDEVQGVDSSGPLVNIHWSAYLANKKASWYAFHELDGEHGYAPDHPLRNASITEGRESLIIDPGVQSVDCVDRRSAEFARGSNPGQSQTFPPALRPFPIDTLGGLKTDSRWRLVLLGGHGCSGSFLTGEGTGFGEPKITSYANNDGWFDDVSDGPVSAILEYHDSLDKENRFVQVDVPAWALVGSPSYAPQLVNMVTLDDLVYDLSVRHFAFNPALYGTDFTKPVEVDAADPDVLAGWSAAPKTWNLEYRPWFYRDIWPILLRPYNAQWVTNYLAISHDAHEIGPGGDFEQTKISQPPAGGQDPYGEMRRYVYEALRPHGSPNAFANTSAHVSDRIYGKPLMPLLVGDNPITNELPSKFLTLTPTQLFLLHQWAVGKFVNEESENFPDPPAGRGIDLDRGVLGNVLGGSFCPGGEVGWIVRNPSIYASGFRLRSNPDLLPDAGSGRASGRGEFFPPALSLTDDLETGLEPGDLTKRSALPWQADYNECSSQEIDVTYESWNVLYDTGGDPAVAPANRKLNITLWWPMHRPMQVYRLKHAESDPTNPGSYTQADWATGIPQTYAGDLMMVDAWRRLGCVVANPYADKFPGVPIYSEGLPAPPQPPPT